MISGAASQRPGESPDSSENMAYLVPLHTRLAGRARFKSRALYRAGSLKQAVETRLQAVAGVQDVAVNTLTGSLLVEFDPALDLAMLLPALEAALAELPLPLLRRPVATPPEPRPGAAPQAEPTAAAARPAPAAATPTPPPPVPAPTPGVCPPGDVWRLTTAQLGSRRRPRPHGRTPAATPAHRLCAALLRSRRTLGERPRWGVL